MGNKSSIGKGVIDWSHLSEPLRQQLRKLATLVNVREVMASVAQRFVNLIDGPQGYSDGKYVRSTSTGITFDDAIPPNEISPAVHVRVALATSGTLDGSTTYDGLTLATAELLLAFNQAPSVGQTHSPNNGVYRKTSGGMERWAEDAGRMRLVHVMEGTFAGMLFELRTDGSITVGTTVLAFSRIDGALFNITKDTAALPYTIPNDLGNVFIQITSSNPTTAKTLTLPRATGYDGTQVWLVWEGGLGAGGSFAVAAQGSESIIGTTSAYSGSREVGIYFARGGNWYRL